MERKSQTESLITAFRFNTGSVSRINDPSASKGAEKHRFWLLVCGFILNASAAAAFPHRGHRRWVDGLKEAVHHCLPHESKRCLLVDISTSGLWTPSSVNSACHSSKEILPTLLMRPPWIPPRSRFRFFHFSFQCALPRVLICVNFRHLWLP